MDGKSQVGFGQVAIQSQKKRQNTLNRSIHRARTQWTAGDPGSGAAREGMGPTPAMDTHTKLWRPDVKEQEEEKPNFSSKSLPKKKKKK